MYLIDNGRRRSHKVQVVFPLQALLDDLQVQKSQESAAESEAQGHGGLRLIEKGSVVQLQLLKGLPQIRILCAVCRVQSAVDHGGHLLIAGKGLLCRVLPSRDGVTHLRSGDVLDAGSHIAYHAGGKLIAGDELSRTEIAHLHHVILRSGGHHPDGHAASDGSLLYAAEYDDALVGVINGIEDKGLKGRLRIAGGSRDLLDDHLQHFLHVKAGLCRDPGSVLRLDADDVLDLPGHPVRVRAGQVDLVDHGKDLQVVVQGQVYIGQGLGLDALGGVHHQDCSVAGSQGTGHLVVEVHVSRSVDEVEDILLSVLCLINGTDGLGLDGNASLPLQIHVVQDLGLHLPLGQKSRHLDDTVRQGGFAVVDMSNDTEVSD